MSYNGWSNYETWNVGLWFGDMFADYANEGQDMNADYLQSTVEEILASEGQLPDYGLAADIMNNFLRKVDWEELAEHYKNEELEAEEEDA